MIQLVDKEKKTPIDAHIGTILRQGNLYLGKIKVPLAREFYQASCGMEGFLEQSTFLGNIIRVQLLYK
jgi:hypothetical protein